jgi:thiol-disulfide isomerase/thioredoxin
MIKYILIGIITLILILVIYYYNETFKPVNENCGCNNGYLENSDVPQEKPKINKNYPTIYNFNTSWCKYSQDFQIIWNEFTEKMKNEKINIIDIKCDNPKYKEFCSKYEIYGYPTILAEKNNKIIPFTSNRTVNDLINFSKKI